MAAYYNEIDPYAAGWLRALIKDGQIADGEVDERSIELVQPADVRRFVQCHWFAGIGGWSYALRLAGWDDDRPCWTGSCPCQPFSSAGRGDAATDPRHLWPEWFRLIRELGPAVVFGEQVAGADGRAWLDLVCDNLEACGYAVGPVDLPACSIGAHHVRQRIWFVADADAERFAEAAVGESAPHQARHVEAPQPAGFAIVGEAGASLQSPWPPGPGRVGEIPRMDDGLPRWVADGFGNAIVPSLGAEVIAAYMDVCALRGDREDEAVNEGSVVSE